MNFICKTFFFKFRLHISAELARGRRKKIVLRGRRVVKHCTEGGRSNSERLTDEIARTDIGRSNNVGTDNDEMTRTDLIKVTVAHRIPYRIPASDLRRTVYVAH